MIYASLRMLAHGKPFLNRPEWEWVIVDWNQLIWRAGISSGIFGVALAGSGCTISRVLV